MLRGVVRLTKGGAMPDGAPIERPAIEALKSRLTGHVLTPGDLEYDNARTVFNAMIDRRPALIARCANTRASGLRITGLFMSSVM